jgi:hypothetical protein
MKQIPDSSRSVETLRCRTASLWLLTLVLVLLPAVDLLAQAAPKVSDDLYQGRATVLDQSPAEQSKGMRAALLQVLGKLSGLSQFDAYPDLSASLSSASNFVLAFYYENHPVLMPDGSTSAGLQLVANFSPRAVEELRNQLQLPRWKPEREPLGVWPIVDDGRDRKIRPIELEYAWARIAGLAADRGMPLRWPEADENGEFTADVQLLWGGYTEELSAAGFGDTLVIAALQDGPEWNVRMSLDYEGLRWSERFRGVDLESLLQQGMNLAIDQIVAASSIAAADSGEWTAELTVTQLGDADDYARCLSYLEGLSVVESVRIKGAAAGRVEFLLTLNAAPAYLQQYLEAGKTLAPGTVEGEYQLQP